MAMPVPPLNIPVAPPSSLLSKVPHPSPPSSLSSFTPLSDGLLSSTSNVSTSSEAVRSVGMIFPPAELRSIIDKTAQFVAKNGPEFESRVLKEQKNMRFAFLYANNPYRAYYEMKVQEFKSGVVGTSQPAVPQAIVDMRKKEEEKKKKKEELMMLTSYSHFDKNLMEGHEENGEMLKPPPSQFIIKHPYITPLDLDIIKTTAQFVARNGNRFIMGLSQREKNNPQFDFLKPTHVLFSYFSSLIDAYTKCLLPEGSQIKTLKSISDNYLDPLNRAHVKCIYQMEEERKRKDKEEKEAEEKMQLAQIDWHDFVVVETLDFTAEDADLSLSAPVDFSVSKPKMPISLTATSGPQQVDNDVEDEENKNKLTDLMKGTEDMELDVEEDMELEEEKAHAEMLAKNIQESEELKEEADEGEAVVPPREKEIKVVKDYVRGKKRAAATTATSGEMQKCPITGKLIPASDMSRHLKVLLLDPKWKQQKERFLEKARKESAFAPLQDVEGNLAVFVARRPDLFGTVEEEIQEHAPSLDTLSGGYDATNALTQSSIPISTILPPSLPFGIPPLPAGAPPLPAGNPPLPAVFSTLPTFPPIQSTTVPLPMPSLAAPPPPEENLIPEAEFIELHTQPIQYKVCILNSLDGESENVVILSTPVDYIEAFKSNVLNKTKKFPGIKSAKQIILKDRKNNAILQDTKTLGYYNLGEKSEFELLFIP